MTTPMTKAMTATAILLLALTTFTLADRGSDSGSDNSSEDDSSGETIVSTDSRTETVIENGETTVRTRDRTRMKVRGKDITIASDEDVRATLRAELRERAAAAADLSGCVELVKAEHPALAEQKLNALCRGLKPEWAREMVAKHLTRLEDACENVNFTTEELPPGQARFCRHYDGLSEEERGRLRTMGESAYEHLSALNEKQLERLKHIRENQLKKLGEFKEDRLRKLLESVDGDTLDRLASTLEPDDLAKLSLLSRAEIKALAGADIAAVRAHLADIQVRAGTGADIHLRRHMAAEHLQRARDQFQKAVERFHNAQGRFEEARKRFAEAQDRERNCTGNTTECQQARGEAKAQAKVHLTALADKILETIAQMEAKIQESEELDETDAAAMLSTLAALKAEVDGAKADVEAADTKDEIKAAGKTLTRVWKGVHLRLLKHRAKLLNGRVERILARSENLENTLERVLARLAENGRNVTALDARVDEFSALIAHARAEYQEGRDALADAHTRANGTNLTGRQVQALIEEAQAHFKTAHEDLKKAHIILQGILADVNAQGARLEDATDTEAEVAQTAQTPIAEEPVQLLVETATEADASAEATAEGGSAESASQGAGPSAESGAGAAATEGQSEGSGGVSVDGSVGAGPAVEASSAVAASADLGAQANANT